MLVIRRKRYLKSLRRVLAGGRITIEEVDVITRLLAKGEGVPGNYKDHALSGELTGYRECHLRSDLLLIYKPNKDNLVLQLVDIGSHAQLFGK